MGAFIQAIKLYLSPTLTWTSKSTPKRNQKLKKVKKNTKQATTNPSTTSIHREEKIETLLLLGLQNFFMNKICF